MNIARWKILLLGGLAALHGCGGDTAVDGKAPAQAAASPYRDGGATPGDRNDSAPDTLRGASSTGSPGTGTLEYPDDLQMVMLGYRATGREPPLDTWAGSARRVRSADEFSRAAALRAERERLAGIYGSTGNVGTLQLRLRSGLSEYDAAAGGFYLDALAPGSTITFREDITHQEVTVRIGNAAAAFFWPVDAGTARDIRGVTGTRVTLDAQLQLAGAETRSSGPQLSTRITRYRIHSSRDEDGGPLAVLTVE